MIKEEKYPRVTTILSKAGLISFSYLNPNVLKNAQKFGTAVHKTTELWDNGTLDISKLSAPLFPYLAVWQKFRADYKIQEFIAIEKKVISEKWQYQGTLDRVAN